MRFKEISSIFLRFEVERNIGTSILPRRKGKKMPKELEDQANKPEVQVIEIGFFQTPSHVPLKFQILHDLIPFIKNKV